MRILRGYATTKDVDLAGDIVKPEGVTFDKLPLPLLGGHDQKIPIGTVVAAKKDTKGVLITAHLFPKGESTLADHWAAAAKYGAATAFSIGFRSDGGLGNSHGGKTFSVTAVREVSLVVFPCNPACVARYSETTDAAPAKPATVKPQAAKPNPKATETTKAIRVPLILMTGYEDAAQVQAIDAHNARAIAHNRLHGFN